MARNHQSTPILGADTQMQFEGTVPPWVEIDSTNSGKTIQEWAQDITQHKIVNIAYGEGDNPRNFELSQEKKMVVTMDEGIEVATVSDRFNLVDNPKVLSVAVDVLKNLNLGHAVFGEGTDYNNKFVADLFFNKSEMKNSTPDSYNNTMQYGISIITANDKSSSIRVSPSVYQEESNSLIRGIGDGWTRLKHIKEEDAESKDMYDQIAYSITQNIVSLPDVATEFLEQTEQAESFPVYFETEDFSVTEFYRTWLGETVPQKVIDTAVTRSQVREGLITENGSPLTDPKLSVWSLVSGFTYAYTHSSNVSDGPTKKRYHNQARDALQNPEETVIDVRKNYVVNQEESKDDTTEDASIEDELSVTEKTAMTQEELRQF